MACLITKYLNSALLKSHDGQKGVNEGLTTLETALSWRVLMAVPKSASFRMPPASSKFSGFRSLWMMPCVQRPFPQRRQYTYVNPIVYNLTCAVT